MLNSEKITVIIVAYQSDMALLYRLLSSVEKHCNLTQVSNIKIIINDHSKFDKNFENVLNDFPNLPLVIIPGTDINPNLKFFNWNTQQFFKCVAAKIVDTEWYIIHDCKDYYIENVDFLSECFTEKNQALVKLDHTNYFHTSRDGINIGFFNLAMSLSYHVYGMEKENWVRWHLPTVTPFFVKTSNMLELVADLENKLQGFFPLLFSMAVNEDRMFTEFMLYSAFCTHKNNLADYADVSYGTEFYNKVKQDKSLRVDFPIDPKVGQKFYIQNYVWIWDGTSWSKNN